MSPVTKGGLRLLVTGGRGRLGAALCREYAGRHRVQPLSRAEVDLADPQAVHEAVSRMDFDVLINTAAFTAVDDCERQRELAYDINAHAAGAMAVVCAEKGARMVQVGTDFVFDGESAGPYAEGAETNPINVYGQSKLLGEAKVLSAHRDALVARVSWVFGPDKPGFPEWLVEQARTQREVGVPGDKIACPTYSIDFAKLLEPFLAGPLPEDGLVHLCNAGAVSWFEYAEYIVGVLRELGAELRLEQLQSTVSNQVAEFRAPRPLRTALCTARYSELTGNEVPDWRKAVRSHIEASCA